MKKKLFTIFLITLLIIGNIWCYITNDRLLNTTTNIVMILLIVFDYVYTKNIKP